MELEEEKALGVNSVQDFTVGPLTGRYDEATAYQRLIFRWRRREVQYIISLLEIYT